MPVSPANEDVLAAGALGALDPLDRRDLVQVLGADDVARVAFEQLERTADLLALTAPPAVPPAGLRARVLGAIASLEASRSPLPQERTVHVPAFDRLLPWIAVAMFAVMCAWIALQMSRARGEIRSLRAALFAPESLRTALLFPADRENAPVAGAAGELRFCTQLQEGRLQVRRLHQLPEGRCYQLWLFDSDHAAGVSAGVFRLRPDGTAEMDFRPVVPVKNVDKAVISLENEGGVPISEGPVVLAGQAW